MATMPNSTLAYGGNQSEPASLRYGLKAESWSKEGHSNLPFALAKEKQM